MGIMLVYDITNEKTFENIVKWLRNIDEVSVYENSFITFKKNKRTLILLFLILACKRRCGENDIGEQK